MLRALFISLLLMVASQSWASTLRCPAGKMLLKEPGASITIEPTGTLRILAIGSSSTAGSGASDPAKSYPHRLGELLRARYPGVRVDVINAGIGGETVGRTSIRLQAMLSTEPYDIVIWQLGTNDALQGVSEEEFKSHVREGAAVAKITGTPLFLMDSQWYRSIHDPVRYRMFVAMVGDIAEELGLVHLHRYRMMRLWDHEDPTSYPSYMARDGFHMGDRGYECLAREMVRSLERMIHIR